MIGAQWAPSLLLPDDRADVAVTMSSIATQPERGFVRAVNLETSPPRLHGDEARADAATAAPSSGTASVVPNRVSCPAADAAALLSPLTVNGAVGSPTPAERPAADAVVGTGSSCPPARREGKTVLGTSTPGAVFPYPEAPDSPPQAANRP